MDWADDDAAVARALEGLARDSLSPDQPTLSRVGATVMAAFEDSAPARGAETAVRPAESGRERPFAPGWSWNRRRAFAALGAVAILTLTTVGIAGAESGPGQPFYHLRLGIEAVNLPAAGSESRLNADLDRADARLDEIAREAASSKWAAAADAAAAYVDTVSGVALPGDEPARSAALTRLRAQLARLEQLRATSQVPETAQLDRAIAAVAQILGIPVPTPPASPTLVPQPKATGPGEGTETEKPQSVSSDPSRPPDPDGSGQPGAHPTETSPSRPGSGEPGDHDGSGAGGNAATPAPTAAPSATATASASDGHAGTPSPSDRP